MDEGRDLITAASAAYLNNGLELTASSVRSSLAPASSSSSGLALGFITFSMRNAQYAYRIGLDV